MKLGHQAVRLLTSLAIVGAISAQLPGVGGPAFAQDDDYSLNLSNRGNAVIQGAVIGLVGYGLYNALSGGGGGGAVASIPPPVVTPGPLPPVNPPAMTAPTGVDPIYDVAASQEQFSSLKKAIDAASYEEKGPQDLVRILRREKEFTLFAPTNSAFARIQSTLDGYPQKNKDMASRAELRGILEYHVVRGKYTMAQLATMNGKTLTTLANTPLNISVSGNTVSVGGVTVVNSDIPCSNGIIHPITGVLQR